MLLLMMLKRLYSKTDPKTDDGLKKSQKGRVTVFDDGDKIRYIDGLNIADENDENMLETVFENGKMIRDETLSEIRERLLSKL